MIFSKKKIFIITGTILGAGLLAGAVVGGHFLSLTKNAYQPYYRNPVYNTLISRVRSYEACVINGAKVVVGAGFVHGDSMADALKNNRTVFGDTSFLFLDGEYSGDYTSQVASSNFRVDQGTFITGIAVGMFLNENKEYFKQQSPYLSYATYGGLNLTNVTSWMVGLQQGINYFNNIIVPKDPKNLEPIYQIIPNDSYAGGFGPSDGDSIITDLLRGNNTKIYEPFIYNNSSSYKELKNVKPEHKIPSILMPVAGPQTFSALRLIKQYNKKTVLIGVDSPMELNSLNQKVPSNPAIVSKDMNYIMFSSLKELNMVGSAILENINLGITDVSESKIPDIGGLGYTSLGTIDNKGVGLSDPGKIFFIKAMAKLKNLEISNNLTSQEIDKFYYEAINYLKNIQYFKDINNHVYKNTHQVVNDPNQVWKQNSGSFYVSGNNVYAYTDLISNARKTPYKDGSIQFENEQEQKFIKSFKKFVSKNNPNASSYVKLVLSEPTSVLLDNGFSQESYNAMHSFFKFNGVNIPATKTSSQELLLLLKTFNQVVSMKGKYNE